jgi:DNA repair photolyase
MVVSASRRTDVPCFFSDWFWTRMKAGFVLVRNPLNTRQIRKVILSVDSVDALVFWSKNPKPMLNHLDKLKGYPFYFQFTLNSYSQDIEPGLPRKHEIIDTFKELSGKTGPERVIWRYDPILLNDKYTIDYHVENFSLIARRLKGYTEKVTISFIDLYSKIMKNINCQNVREISFDDKHKIAKELPCIAAENGFLIDTCAEDIDLSMYGITHARCIDDRLIERISGRDLKVKKDKSQRAECGCVASVDIGAYNSCMNGCLYCYANYSRLSVERNYKQHNPASPLLIGETPEALLKPKEVFSRAP